MEMEMAEAVQEKAELLEAGGKRGRPGRPAPPANRHSARREFQAAALRTLFIVG